MLGLNLHPDVHICLFDVRGPQQDSRLQRAAGDRDQSPRRSSPEGAAPRQGSVHLVAALDFSKMHVIFNCPRKKTNLHVLTIEKKKSNTSERKSKGGSNAKLKRQIKTVYSHAFNHLLSSSQSILFIFFFSKRYC